MLSKTYAQTIETDAFLIGTDASSPATEDVSKLVGEDILRKFLSFNKGQVTFEYWVKSGPVTLTAGLIAGANDTNAIPEREAVRMVISNEAAYSEVALPLALNHGDHGVFPIPEISGQRFFVTIENADPGHNSGASRIVQFGPLVFPEMGDTRFPDLFEDLEPGPLPDPTPDTSLSCGLTIQALTGAPVSIGLSPAGGTSPYFHSLRSAPWLDLDDRGGIHGTPPEAGDYDFFLTTTDSLGETILTSGRVSVRDPQVRQTLAVFENGNLVVNPQEIPHEPA